MGLVTEAENPAGPVQLKVAPAMLGVLNNKVSFWQSGALDQMIGAGGILLMVTSVSADKLETQPSILTDAL